MHSHEDVSKCFDNKTTFRSFERWSLKLLGNGFYLRKQYVLRCYSDKSLELSVLTVRTDNNWSSVRFKQLFALRIEFTCTIISSILASELFQHHKDDSRINSLARTVFSWIHHRVVTNYVLNNFLNFVNKSQANERDIFSCNQKIVRGKKVDVRVKISRHRYHCSKQNLRKNCFSNHEHIDNAGVISPSF